MYPGSQAVALQAHGAAVTCRGAPEDPADPAHARAVVKVAAPFPVVLRYLEDPLLRFGVGQEVRLALLPCSCFDLQV